MPDWDILKSDNFFNYGIKEICEANTTWLTNEIERAVTIKKEDMRSIRKGAVIESEPKIIYVKMIYRPTKNQVVAARNKFNDALEGALLSKHGHYIMELRLNKPILIISTT